VSVNLPVMGVLEEVPGIRVGTADADIRDTGRDDVAVFAFEPGATVAAFALPLFTMKPRAGPEQADAISTGAAL
jgi:hypothetical protein